MRQLLRLPAWSAEASAPLPARSISRPRFIVDPSGLSGPAEICVYLSKFRDKLLSLSNRGTDVYFGCGISVEFRIFFFTIINPLMFPT
jgi:hypothetical protein